MVGPQRRRLVWLYRLLEHQSEPDALMPIRLLDYLVQIIKRQMRVWANKLGSLTGFRMLRMQPVLPVVLYTGTMRWDSPGRLIDLVDRWLDQVVVAKTLSGVGIRAPR